MDSEKILSLLADKPSPIVDIARAFLREYESRHQAMSSLQNSMDVIQKRIDDLIIGKSTENPLHPDTCPNLGASEPTLATPISNPYPPPSYSFSSPPSPVPSSSQTNSSYVGPHPLTTNDFLQDRLRDDKLLKILWYRFEKQCTQWTEVQPQQPKKFLEESSSALCQDLAPNGYLRMTGGWDHF